jgi:hypothetical protein
MSLTFFSHLFLCLGWSKRLGHLARANSSGRKSAPTHGSGHRWWPGRVFIILASHVLPLLPDPNIQTILAGSKEYIHLALLKQISIRRMRLVGRLLVRFLRGPETEDEACRGPQELI